MAVRIYKRSRFWWISYVDKYGKRQQKSTGQTDKKIAEYERFSQINNQKSI